MRILIEEFINKKELIEWLKSLPEEERKKEIDEIIHEFRREKYEGIKTD